MAFREKLGFKSGFTLVELMVAIAIMGILSSIAIPNFIGWLPDYRLRSATRDIVSSMQDAKLRAVKENANVVIIFNQNVTFYRSFFDTDDSDDFDPDEDILVRQVTLPAGIDIQTDYTVEFTSRGLAKVAGSVQIINNKSNLSKIIVNKAGNIRVE